MTGEEFATRVRARIDAACKADPRGLQEIASLAFPDVTAKAALQRLYRTRLEAWPEPDAVVAIARVLEVDPGVFYAEE